jgi:hypothetical protein
VSDRFKTILWWSLPAVLAIGIFAATLKVDPHKEALR